jgi:hypothetical protein
MDMKNRPPAVPDVPPVPNARFSETEMEDWKEQHLQSAPDTRVYQRGPHIFCSKCHGRLGRSRLCFWCDDLKGVANENQNC